MFRRKTSPGSQAAGAGDSTADAVATSANPQVNDTLDADDQPSSKGRPTPSRKEAEAARKQRVKPALTRREQLKRDREKTREQRQRTRRAMETGNEKYFMPRDQGPIRKFVRDYVDSRRTIGEYFLPIIILVLVASVAGGPQVQLIATAVWLVLMILLVVDMTLLARRVKREIRNRFPDESGKGHAFYAISRATQIRRLRLPKPTVKPGALV